MKAQQVYEQHRRAGSSLHQTKGKSRFRVGSYPTAWWTIRGYEMMNMIRKGQIEGADKGKIKAQNQFIAGLFGLVV